MNTQGSFESTPDNSGCGRSAYDRVLYPDRAYKETHPDHLAMIGTLYGMNPPAVDSCRVLEIGCGAGGNLIPMAASLPDSQFLGIDLASGPIESGQCVIERTRLRNVQLRAMDLLEVTPEFGRFDYIVAHGFYSWVPQHVQEKLFAFCRESLTPNGIAFVSYNTYPEGHMRRAVREMLLFHTAGLVEDSKIVSRSKDFLKFARDSINGADIWKEIVRLDFERISKRDDNVIYHDELSPFFSPVYFKDFMESAENHGLQFLSEAMLRDMLDSVKPEIRERINTFANGDVIRFEQYLDFLLF